MHIKQKRGALVSLQKEIEKHIEYSKHDTDVSTTKNEQTYYTGMETAFQKALILINKTLLAWGKRRITEQEVKETLRFLRERGIEAALKETGERHEYEKAIGLIIDLTGVRLNQ